MIRTKTRKTKRETFARSPKNIKSDKTLLLRQHVRIPEEIGVIANIKSYQNFTRSQLSKNTFPWFWIFKGHHVHEQELFNLPFFGTNAFFGDKERSFSQKIITWSILFIIWDLIKLFTKSVRQCIIWQVLLIQLCPQVDKKIPEKTGELQ